MTVKEFKRKFPGAPEYFIEDVVKELYPDERIELAHEIEYSNFDYDRYLSRSFIWSSSRKGHEYWSNIDSRLDNKSN